MSEITININAAELASAINHLADAISRNTPVAPTASPAPTAPVAPVASLAPAVPNASPAPAVPPAAASYAAVPTIPTAPAPDSAAQAAAPAAQAAAPAVPAPVPTAAPQYTLDMIATAGSYLIDAGKMDPLMDLLHRFGVDSLVQLPPESYGAMANELRLLGARL